MSSEQGIPEISTPWLCLKGHLFGEYRTPWQLDSLLHIIKSIVRSGLAKLSAKFLDVVECPLSAKKDGYYTYFTS
jgi:hypothetical protein